MTRKEIILNMGCSDMTNKTLLHKLKQYVDVCMVEVDKIICKGVNGSLEKFVAWVLGLKKYIPDGWHPEKIEPVKKIQQLSLPLQTSPYKGVGYDRTSGLWVARYCTNSKSYTIGTFHTDTEAALAYNREAKVLGKPLNVLRD